MKPKLLITLGCSWTEGIGTKDPIKSSWPRKLGELLGFDKVINLGKAGSSNSGQIKLFYEYLYSNSFSEYEVLVLFYMTEPSRFSFYSEGEIKNFMITQDWNLHPLEREYLNIVNDIEIDPTLEQVFYTRTLEQSCKTNNFDLIVTSWVGVYHLFFKLYGNNKINLFRNPSPVLPPIDKDITYYAPCSHPNEKGYEWIANEMVKGIKENHSKWYNPTPNHRIEYITLDDINLNKGYNKNMI